MKTSEFMKDFYYIYRALQGEGVVYTMKYAESQCLQFEVIC